MTNTASLLRSARGKWSIDMDFDEFYNGIPAHLTLRQRRKLYREHKFYEWCRALGIIALILAAGLIAGGCQ